MSDQVPTSRSARTAFTVVEILVVIALIGVVVSILLPTLSVARERAREVACLSNARQVTQLVGLYMGEFDDRVPSFLGDTRAVVAATPSLRYRFVMQSRFLWVYPPWQQWSGIAPAGTIFQCVADPTDYEGRPPHEIGGTWNIASAFYTRDDYFDDRIPDGAWAGVFPGQRRALHDAAFPSEKVFLYESDIYHAWRPPHIGGDGYTLGRYGTHGRGAVAMTDGSGRLVGSDRDSAWVARMDDRWVGGRFDSPRFGLQGREFRAGGWLNSPYDPVARR
ncbi:MAG: type II secretion system protein [Phycisphaerales bacterium]